MDNLLVGWFVGLLISFVINVCGDTQPISRFAFNVLMWPFAVLIVCFKGALTHFDRKPKRKRNAR